MKTKEIIKILTEAKEWTPDIFTVTIDEAIKRLEVYEKQINNINHKREAEAKKLAEQENLFASSIWELQFANTQKTHFDNLLSEVETLVEKWVKPNLIKKVIENGRQRAVLDICLHYDMQVWI